MTKEEIKAFKPIINSMKLLREHCEEHERCYGCTFFRNGCTLGIPITWNCEESIAALEAEEAEDEQSQA